MYTVKESGLLWTVCRSGEPPHVPFCVTDYGTKGESDARTIADALNEREAMRAEVERLRGALEAINAYVSGEWDNAALMAFGPLSADSRGDMQQIARAALATPQEATQ